MAERGEIIAGIEAYNEQLSGYAKDMRQARTSYEDGNAALKELMAHAQEVERCLGRFVESSQATVGHAKAGLQKLEAAGLAVNSLGLEDSDDRRINEAPQTIDYLRDVTGQYVSVIDNIGTMTGVLAAIIRDVKGSTQEVIDTASNHDRDAEHMQMLASLTVGHATAYVRSI